MAVRRSQAPAIETGADATRHALPLYPGAQPCIRSGYCCRVAPCPFGDWDDQAHQCTELIDLEGRPACRRYHEILAMPRECWELAPAFGAGCSSSLNATRHELLRGSQ